MFCESTADSPLATIETFNRQFHLGEKERQVVKWGWKKEPGTTVFNVVNAYSRPTQFGRSTAEGSYRPQKVRKAIFSIFFFSGREKIPQ